MSGGVTIYLEAQLSRAEVRELAKRDPRKEKQRDFRKSRRASCNPRCAMCQPQKRWKALRAATRRERKRIGLTPLSPRP